MWLMLSICCTKLRTFVRKACGLWSYNRFMLILCFLIRMKAPLKSNLVKRTEKEATIIDQNWPKIWRSDQKFLLSAVSGELPSQENITFQQKRFQGFLLNLSRNNSLVQAVPDSRQHQRSGVDRLQVASRHLEHHLRASRVHAHQSGSTLNPPDTLVERMRLAVWQRGQHCNQSLNWLTTGCSIEIKAYCFVIFDFSEGLFVSLRGIANWLQVHKRREDSQSSNDCHRPSRDVFLSMHLSVCECVVRRRKSRCKPNDVQLFAISTSFT